MFHFHKSLLTSEQLLQHQTTFSCFSDETKFGSSLHTFFTSLKNSVNSRISMLLVNTNFCNTIWRHFHIKLIRKVTHSFLIALMVKMLTFYPVKRQKWVRRKFTDTWSMETIGVSRNNRVSFQEGGAFQPQIKHFCWLSGRNLPAFFLTWDSV